MRRSEAASPSVIDDILRYALAIGATLVVLLPAARGSHEALGWLPLWLLGMPLSAWAALLWFRRIEDHHNARTVDARRGIDRATLQRGATASRCRVGPQARRRGSPRKTPSLPRAA